MSFAPGEYVTFGRGRVLHVAGCSTVAPQPRPGMHQVPVADAFRRLLPTGDLRPCMFCNPCPAPPTGPIGVVR